MTLISLVSTPFFANLGPLDPRLDRGSIFALREEAGVLESIFSNVLIRYAHGLFLHITKLNFENERGVEVGVVEKRSVLGCNVVRDVVLPDGLWAVRALYWDVCTWGCLRRLLC
jgi:hypothetical protein